MSSTQEHLSVTFKRKMVEICECRYSRSTPSRNRKELNGVMLPTSPWLIAILNKIKWLSLHFPFYHFISRLWSSEIFTMRTSVSVKSKIGNFKRFSVKLICKCKMRYTIEQRKFIVEEYLTHNRNLNPVGPLFQEKFGIKPPKKVSL